MTTLLFSSFATDVNPLTPSSTPPIPPGYAAGAGSDPARVAAQEYYLASGSDCSLRETTAFTGTQYSATVQIGTAGSSSHGPQLTDENGNGYKLLVRNTDLRLYKVVNGVLGAHVPPTLSIAVASSSFVELEQNESINGQLAYINDEPVQAWGDLTYTQVRYPACFSRGGRIKSLTSAQVITGPVISDINGDNIVVAGEPLTLATSSFVDPVTSLTIGGTVVPGLIPTTEGNYSAPAAPFFIDNTIDPGFGTLPAIAANAEETASRNVTRELPEGWTFVTYEAPLSTDPGSISERTIGATIEDGDEHYHIAAEIAIYPDSTFTGAPTGTITTWLRKAGTGLMVELPIINGVPTASGGRGIVAQPVTALGIVALPILAEAV